MFKIIFRSVIATLVLAVVFGGVYPAVVYGIGKLVFQSQAGGQLVYTKDGHLVGSKLIGQAFTKPEYFHGRPSAAGTGYDAANSSGSNLGPTNQKFIDTLNGNVAQVLKDNPALKKGEVPVELVTASASGLDPHLTPEGMMAQVSRVAQIRKIPEADLKKFVESHTEAAQLGFLGEPVVNVLMANIDLDRMYPLAGSPHE